MLTLDLGSDSSPSQGCRSIPCPPYTHTCTRRVPTHFCAERASSSSGRSGRSRTTNSTPISSTILCFRAGFCFFSSSGAGGTPSDPASFFSLGF